MAVRYTSGELSFSTTERQEFLRCRRAWDFQSPNRKSLQRKGLPQVALHVGSAVHYGLEAQALGLDPLAAVERFFEAESQRIAREYVDRVGAPLSLEERNQMTESKALVRSMIKRYFDRWGWEKPLGEYEYIAPEVSFRVPIPLEKYADEIEYSGPRLFLVGTFDGLGKRIAEEFAANATLPEIWLIEHKTYSQRPDFSSLMTDDQMHGYAWAAQQLFRVPIAGALYDGIAKKSPTIPQILIAGTVSLAWVDTDAETMLKRIVECHGEAWHDLPLMAGKKQKVVDGRPQTLMDHYEPFITRLEERDASDQTPFHTRHKVRFKQHAIQRWEQDLCQLAVDMVDPKIYPNFPWSGCWDCNVRDLCNAVQFGEDLDYVVRRDYKVGTYGTRKAQKDLTPEEVTSIEDLERIMERKRSEYAWVEPVREAGDIPAGV